MFTPNGVSDTTSITKTRIKNFFRSMRLRVFLIVAAVTCAIGCIVSIVSFVASKSLAVESRTVQVMDYADKLITKMVNNVYTAYPAQSTDINKELELVSSLYDGRIIVTNSRLTVIYDSYHFEEGKTIVSSEAIGALKGNSNEYRDRSEDRIELCLPIRDISMLSANTPAQNTANYSVNTTVQGVLIISFSVRDCAASSIRLRNIQMFTGAILGLLVLVLGIFAAKGITRPLVKISQSLNDTYDGNPDEEMHISGFSEMDDISDSYNKMLGRMASIEESRQEFVSNVSHELKTPLTSMKVLSDSLIEQPDAPVELYREFMTDINAEVDRENKIINDLLALVKLDRKSGDMHIASVNINELLDLVVRRIKPIAQAADVEIIYESYREVLAEVDEVKLILAITNLVENGIKYNKEGGSVTISLNADHKFFMVTVTDTGIGIPKAALDRIFERFYRVDKMRSRQTGGTGLGLAITKSVVKMHHGSIKVESTEGEGSTFMIKIPLSYIPEV
ncbi:MAG: ATP-binding protein [Lachnospiraceae bacterium]|nr:ATP-binding protein [Lachnospiraceae bacterium]